MNEREKFIAHRHAYMTMGDLDNELMAMDRTEEPTR